MTSCPACGRMNPDTVIQCECGHIFGTTAPVPSTDPAAPPQPSTRRLFFHGDARTLFTTYLMNLLLTLVTLGVYYFWGKVKVRKYIYSQTEFEGDRLAYHGTPKELLLGWLKAAAVLGVLFGISAAAGQEIGRLISAFISGVLIPVAIVGSWRYRLSRTSWRGIRFSFWGHARELVGLFWRDGLLMTFTLGIYYPHFRNHLRTFLMQNSHYGTRPFDYDGDGWEVWRIYASGIVLTILTLGIYYFWFDAKLQRYYWSHTTFGRSRAAGSILSNNSSSEVRFNCSIQGGAWMKLKLVNLLAIVCTLGLAYPWTVVRSTRYLYDNLTIEGPLDLAAIQQEAQAATATGEGLAGFMDTGLLDLDLGF